MDRLDARSIGQLRPRRCVGARHARRSSVASGGIDGVGKGNWEDGGRCKEEGVDPNHPNSRACCCAFCGRSRRRGVVVGWGEISDDGEPKVGHKH